MSTRRVHAALARLPGGWARDVLMEVGADGAFTNVTPNADAAGAERIDGVVLPGMVNAHSHAFQRAMVGLTQCAGGSGQDNFWSWRTLMYAFANRLTPEQVEAIATWLYIEMLRGGYTHVCEFHYLHHAPDGRPYARPAEMSEAIVRAAQTAGIGLTLLPVLYMTRDFGGAPTHEGQRRFAWTVDGLLDLIGGFHKRFAGSLLHNVGVAPHSLRAVPPGALAEIDAGLAAIAPRAPVHIHIAEQTGEVDACVAWSGRRPVEWLNEHVKLDARWNLVHATHMTRAEAEAVARSGATAVLCPTTEADLGDGVFPYPEYAAAGGRWAIGSDSQVARDWWAELRMLEYSQRLATRRRNVAAEVATASASNTASANAPQSTAGISTGDTLFVAAMHGGAVASGLPLGQLAPGHRADWLLVRAGKLAFAGREPGRYLDSLLFDHHAADYADVVVSGRSVSGVFGEGGKEARAGFAAVLEELR